MSGPLMLETEEEVKSPSRPSLCIESVPVWLLPQFPPLLNIGPETVVVVAGRARPRGPVHLCCHVLHRESQSQIGLRPCKAHPGSPLHPVFMQEQGDKGQGGHF